MPPIRVTAHAVERYLERIGAESTAEAMAVLTGPVVAAAAAFGSRIVRLPKGRVIIDFQPSGPVVITVVPLDHLPFQLIPPSWGGPPWFAVDPSLPSRNPVHG